MLNQCILTGNLGADPEVFYSVLKEIQSPHLTSHSNHQKRKPVGSKLPAFTNWQKSQRSIFIREHV